MLTSYFDAHSVGDVVMSPRLPSLSQYILLVPYLGWIDRDAHSYNYSHFTIPPRCEIRMEIFTMWRQLSVLVSAIQRILVTGRVIHVRHLLWSFKKYSLHPLINVENRWYIRGKIRLCYILKLQRECRLATRQKNRYVWPGSVTFQDWLSETHSVQAFPPTHLFY